LIPNLRRLCGWERTAQVPSEATFSRAFDEFAALDLPGRVHEALIRQYQSERLVGHISRDATDIHAREKPVPKPPKPAPVKVKGKRGRLPKGEVRPPKAPTVLERQPSQSVSEMVAGLPRVCDWGVKRKTGGTHFWKGYKCHVDWADGEIPISYLVTSASVHDSQVAIPLAAMSAGRVQSFYDLMDQAYDAEAIRSYSRSLGHVPIIDLQRRRGDLRELSPAEKRRYCERTTAERGFSQFKENFGGRDVRVQGYMKVMAHIGFCLLTLTADRLLNLLL
jgi:hypothetical protein